MNALLSDMDRCGQEGFLEDRVCLAAAADFLCDCLQQIDKCSAKTLVSLQMHPRSQTSYLVALHSNKGLLRRLVRLYSYHSFQDMVLDGLDLEPCLLKIFKKMKAP